MKKDVKWPLYHILTRIRDNNAFLLKKRDVKKSFSTEASNLTNVSSFRYSGLVHKKTVGIVQTANRKGFTAVLRKGKYAQRSSNNIVRVTFWPGQKCSLKKLKNLLTGFKYHKDLTLISLHHGSALVRSQKPVQAKKVGKKTE